MAHSSPVTPSFLKLPKLSTICECFWKRSEKEQAGANQLAPAASPPCPAADRTRSNHSKFQRSRHFWLASNAGLLRPRRSLRKLPAPSKGLSLARQCSQLQHVQRKAIQLGKRSLSCGVLWWRILSEDRSFIRSNRGLIPPSIGRSIKCPSACPHLVSDLHRRCAVEFQRLQKYSQCLDLLVVEHHANQGFFRPDFERLVILGSLHR